MKMTKIDTLDEIKHRYISHVFQQLRGKKNQAQIADILEISVNTLKAKL